MGTKNNQTAFKAVGGLLHTDSQVPAPTELTEHGKVELVPTWRFHLCVLASYGQEDTPHAI